jgi:hypothetical protein
MHSCNWRATAVFSCISLLAGETAMSMNVVCSRVALAAALLAVGACGADESDSKNGFEASLRLSQEATAADVGLPAYPGSKLFKEPGDSSSGARVGLSTPMFGFKVVAVKLKTPDEPEQVAAFYRRALSKYGNVLECGDGADEKGESRSDGELTCDSDDSDADTIVYKAGTNQSQRIVAIKPHGRGTQFDLVHLDMRGESKR